MQPHVIGASNHRIGRTARDRRTTQPNKWRAVDQPRTLGMSEGASKYCDECAERAVIHHLAVTARSDEFDIARLHSGRYSSAMLVQVTGAFTMGKCDYVMGLLIATGALSGCGKPKEATKAINEPEKPLRTQVDPPPRSAEARSTPKSEPETPIAQEFKVSTAREVLRAFEDNPLRANQKYVGMRWRLRARVDEFRSSGELVAVISNAGGDTAFIKMRSAQEVEKVTRHKPVLIEARITHYALGYIGGITFDDGMVIEPFEYPKLVPITRELDASAYKELVEAFDHGQDWGSAKYELTRWRFFGVVRPAASGPRGLAVDPIGVVGVAFAKSDWGHLAQSRCEAQRRSNHQ